MKTSPFRPPPPPPSSTTSRALPPPPPPPGRNTAPPPSRGDAFQSARPATHAQAFGSPTHGVSPAFVRQVEQTATPQLKMLASQLKMEMVMARFTGVPSRADDG